MAMPRVLCRVRLLINNDFSVISKYSSVANSVSINKCAQFRHSVRHFRTNFPAGLVLNSKHNQDDRSSASTSSDSDSTDTEDDDVTIEYIRGLPQVTVPLPSRRERCRFTLKPISNTVGDFIDMLKKEDKGIDRVVCKATDGTRIASSTSIETLLQEDFKLLINDNAYNVDSPKQERLTTEEVQRLDDVKKLISQLYESMNVKEHQIQKEVELTTQLETLQQEIMPLEEKMLELEQVANRRSNWMAWAGLGLMSVQFGILARLTWWEYSWDIMEPVTYFVTYGTAMAAYAYFVLTREEYILNDVRDRQHLLLLHKRAKKTGFDVNQYNVLKDQIAKLELDLRRLRDPLKLKLPPKPKQEQKETKEETTTKE
ncbi:calcium uniporter protein, mitochondrial isoform X2 [Zophobas morio]|uniref:calcium uniporter protein, mitochondrial isoform X2 n=1 Tax=Zophobas morio TaxID=2755281 RepID=UPI00308273AE